MSDPLRFNGVYRRLMDDELARVALEGNLVPEAREALTIELQKRGLTDLSEYENNLAQAAAVSSFENQLAIQAQMKRQLLSWLLTFFAWVMALFVPFAWLISPNRTDNFEVSLMGGAFVAFSCYLGIRSRATGSQWGYRLRFLLPLILLGVSTVVATSTMFF
jgi:hypothetical protein